MSDKTNLVLIGMPGAGKSTVGVVLAKKLGYYFMDSDLVIQEQEQRLLHEIIAQEGLQGFLEIENRINASLNAEHSIIATGGSVIYGTEAMAHFKQIGTVIYLKLSYEAIENRLGDLRERGVALKEHQTLAQLYAERTPLYEQYADIIIDCEELVLREVVEQIIQKLENHP
ncbi:MAG: shikimate kinase [Lachnospiraceae bacterium]